MVQIIRSVGVGGWIDQKFSRQVLDFCPELCCIIHLKKILLSLPQQGFAKEGGRKQKYVNESDRGWFEVKLFFFIYMTFTEAFKIK